MGSGACGVRDMPVEVLSKIAEHLDLATQVSVWQTNKHLCKSLGGEVQFVKDFESSACSVPLDLRCSAETFALCGIELLMNLPPGVSLSGSHVQMVYKDGECDTEEVNVWHLESPAVTHQWDPHLLKQPAAQGRVSRERRQEKGKHDLTCLHHSKQGHQTLT